MAKSGGGLDGGKGGHLGMKQQYLAAMQWRQQ